MTAAKARKLAEKIADELFTNGQNQVAQRLVIELPGKQDGGGWCRISVVGIIARNIVESK
jgi:hypothetical protein